MAKSKSNVVRFADYEPHQYTAVHRDEPATITILPVIRIEPPPRRRPGLGDRMRALRELAVPAVDKPCDTE